MIDNNSLKNRWDENQDPRNIGASRESMSYNSIEKKTKEASSKLLDSMSSSGNENRTREPLSPLNHSKRRGVQKTLKQVKKRKSEVRKWTVEQDKALLVIINELRNGNRKVKWREIAESHGYGLTSKQCCERYKHHLDPTIDKSELTLHDLKKLSELVKTCVTEKGSISWTKIAEEFPGRTDQFLKNKWNIAKVQIVKKKIILPENDKIEEIHDESSFSLSDEELNPFAVNDEVNISSLNDQNEHLVPVILEEMPLSCSYLPVGFFDKLNQESFFNALDSFREG